MREAPHLDQYLSHLAEMPFVRSVQLKPLTPGRAEGSGVAILTLKTSAGSHELVVEELRSHVTHEFASHLIERARRTRSRGANLLVLAPHIGVELGRRLSQAGINYLDRQGNCHLALGGHVLVHIEGRGAARVTATEKGIRAPGYQVLFALLAEPSLVEAPVRSLAQAAGTSRQPVVDMRRRLLAEGYLLETRKAAIWQPRRREDAMNLWLYGYETTVRPTLFVGAYRTPDRSPSELERRVAPILDREVSDWRWGGAAAGFRLVPHHRGERTVVHVHEAPGDLGKKLGGLPQAGGNLTLLRAFGDLNWAPKSKLVHPLLAYSEMLVEKDDRTSEAARELFEKHIVTRWSAPP